MKFYAEDLPIHIALTSGITTLVTKEGTELTKEFYSEAIARGCLTEPAGVVSEEEIISRPDQIKAVLTEMINGDNEDDFKNDGTPDLRRVSAKVGFRVTKEEVDLFFAELTE